MLVNIQIEIDDKKETFRLRNDQTVSKEFPLAHDLESNKGQFRQDSKDFMLLMQRYLFSNIIANSCKMECG